MAAEVSSVTRTLKRYAEDEKGKRELVTRDLLGGGAVMGNGELDLEIKAVQSGWERRLDLMPAKNYQPIHDLNLPPPPLSASPSTADFNLLSAAPPRTSPSSSSCHAVSAYSSSVCTLDKVRSALERESRGARPAPRSDGSSSPSSSSSSAAAAAAKRLPSPPPPPRDSPIGGGEMRAAACPTCLIYVLIAAVDPRCPRCDAQVPALPALTLPNKKPRIDLNAAAEDND